jgi:hypothetical protein
MIYELRVYHCVPGRLPVLLKRFESTTLDLWKRHGIRQAGFWTVAIGESNQALYYMLQWESLAERERVWAGFMSDPEWLAKRAESEKDGAIVAKITNTILQPTAFSSVK